LLRAQPILGAGGGRGDHRRLALSIGLVVLLALVGGLLAQRPARAAPLPAGFSEEFFMSGLQRPVSLQFSPDGRVFVAEKSGLVKVFDGLGDTTPQVFADLRTRVLDYADRGLLGFALDPHFPEQPYAYALYAYDAAIGGTAPRWNDTCPGGTVDGCLASGRLSRLKVEGNAVVSEQVLVNDWCMQFPSHATGELRFGPDGALYASAGDGANFTVVDYGQRGSPSNPCGDPPGGGGLTPPAAEGGALRSQDLRSGGDPVGLDGTVVRVDPATGAGLPDNPLASSADPNARRIVAYGLRNPFRMAFRPGAGDLWVGDVGWNKWEEIDRIQDPTASVKNFGWPCYEGDGRQPGYDGANLSLCERLYAEPDAVTRPWYAYTRDAPKVPGEAERCLSNGQASTSGLAFYGGDAYPAAYSGALFFADYSRSCIYVMWAAADGLPDPAQVEAFATAARPVYLTVGPDGNLWYVDLGGTVRRIVYQDGQPNRPPAAAVTATPTQGSAPLTVQFDGSGSSDPDAGDAVAAYDWDLNGDGTFGDASGQRPTWTYRQAGEYTASLRVTDSYGARSTPATVHVSAGNTAPTARITAPSSGTTWQAGQTITFAGGASDAQDGTLPAARLSWTVTLEHCAEGGGCHAHPLQDLTGVAGGSFQAPDHDYPSYLQLQLTATDSGGLSDSTTLRLDPRSVDLTFTSEPSGLSLTVGSSSQVTPFTRRVIVGSANSVSAPAPQAVDGVDQLFAFWSDGGAASHDLVAPPTASTYTARYRTADGPVPAPSAVGLQASTALADPGQEVVLDGRLTAAQDGAAIGGAEVELHARPEGSALWARVDQAATGADGAVRFSQRPSRTTEYQLRFGGSADHLPSASTVAAVTVRYRVAARIGASSIPLGHSARIAGTVAPAAPGEVVALDQWTSGGWRQLRTTRLDQASGFAFAVTPSSTGSTRFRVRKLSGDASADGTSAAMTLKVYRTVIAAIRIVRPGLNGEYLELRNTGASDVNLATWTVHHTRLGWTLRLRPYTLRAGARVRIYSGNGSSGNGRLFLNRRISVWRSSHSGDVVQVLDGYRQLAAAARYLRS